MHPCGLVYTCTLSLPKASGLPVCCPLFVPAFAVPSAVVGTTGVLSCLSTGGGHVHQPGLDILRIIDVETFLIYLNLTLALLHFKVLDLPECILITKFCSFLRSYF